MRARLQVSSRFHACIALAKGESQMRVCRWEASVFLQNEDSSWESRGDSTLKLSDKSPGPPAGPRSPPLYLSRLCVSPSPQCMLPPCPWRGQDIERRSTVYTFQNGQPCRVMGQSDRVTRQARILPRVLKGDIP